MKREWQLADECTRCRSRLIRIAYALLGTRADIAAGAPRVRVDSGEHEFAQRGYVETRCADHFRGNGPEAFFTAQGYPPVALGEPEQVLGWAGDLLLAHYLLGHNIGGNVSAATRTAAYFRVRHREHEPRWREFLRDAWADYAPVRDLLVT